MKTFDEPYSELERKLANRQDGSRTVAQIQAGVHAIGKKIVEEAAEVWIAAEHEPKERTASEISMCRPFVFLPLQRKAVWAVLLLPVV